MKRLAILMFCGAANAGGGAMDCTDGVCRIEQPQLQAMYESREAMRKERDAAMEAVRTIRERAQAALDTACGQFI